MTLLLLVIFLQQKLLVKHILKLLIQNQNNQNILFIEKIKI